MVASADTFASKQRMLPVPRASRRQAGFGRTLQGSEKKVKLFVRSQTRVPDQQFAELRRYVQLLVVPENLAKPLMIKHQIHDRLIEQGAVRAFLH